MKVYAILEHWDNCESYEDKAYNTELLNIAASENIARELIFNRRNELISIADNCGYEYAYKDVEICKDSDGLYGISFQHWPSQNVFGTYSFGYDDFYWSIKERDVIES